MSDVSQGPGWWQASDGKWYPPESAPGYQPPAPAYQQPGAAAPQPGFQQPQPGVQQPLGTSPQPSEKSGCRTAFFVVLGICMVMALLVGGCTALFGGRIRDSVEETFDEAIEEIERIEEEERERAERELEDGGIGDGIGGTAGDDEIADFAGCTEGDDLGYMLTVFNNSSVLRDYRITLDLIDDEGGSAGTEIVNVLAVAPGETATELAQGAGVSVVDCELAEIRATPSDNNPDVLANVGSCEVNQVGGSAVPSATITNSAPASANFKVIAVVFDETGVRRGAAAGAAGGVIPGDPQPLTFTNNVLAIPPGDFTCEIRTAKTE